jgi:D-glycero-D-manno-heptose 1,7-bisphosphate phosphatase
VFLDRDGVIVRSKIVNGKPYAVRCLDEFRLLPGAKAAIASLHRAGFLVIVVTNQPDIGNGLVEPETVEMMHDRLRRELAITDIETCPHAQTVGCDCRKPKTGMLIAAGRRYGIDFSRSFMVGDRASDILAGANAGCYTVFLNRGYDGCEMIEPDRIMRSLPEAVRHILALTSRARKARRGRNRARITQS